MARGKAAGIAWRLSGCILNSSEENEKYCNARNRTGELFSLT